MEFLICITAFLFAFDQVNAKLDECTNNNSTQCLCILARKQYQYKCPPENSKIVIKSTPKGYLNIRCYDMVTFDITLLPNYTCGEADRMKIEYCPLPKDTFKPLLNKFHMNNVKNFELCLNESSKENISKNIFYGLNQIETLILSFVQALDDDFLEHLPKLSKLYLETGNLTNLKNIKFPTTLKILHITKHHLTDVPQNIFQNLTQLQHFHLWGNEITSIKRMDFTGLRNLISLELYFNKIRYIEDDSFSNLTELTTINLGENKITKINSPLFQNNKKLIEIRMENNPHLNLPDLMFANLVELKIVRIENSRIDFIPENIFENSTNITNLYMQKNHIRNVPNKLFKKLIKLEVLDLSNNYINDLPDDIFTDLISLKTLNLDYNNITYISKDLLKNTKGLTSLSISYNKISDIHIETFLWPKKLRELDLSNNYIADAISPFTHCNALEYINLTNNIITQFPSFLLNLTNIEEIYLSFNKIQTLKILEIATAISLNIKIVNLSNNEIQVVNFEDIQKQSHLNRKILDANHNTSNKIKLDLKNNPLTCDCGNYNLVLYMKNSTALGVKALVDIDVNGIECKKPEVHKSFIELKPEDISCQNNTITCPEKCSCSQWPYYKSIYVDCSNKNLTRFPQINISSQNLSINLGGNYLQDGLQPGLGYENVKILVLSNNKLQNLEWIPIGLRVLKLDRNELAYINPNLFTKTENLTTVQLSNNPWSCECSSRDLQRFIKEHKYVNPQDVLCKEDLTPLIEKTELCRISTTVTLFSVLPVLFLLLLIVTGLILYIYYRQEVKVWLFAKNLCLWFVTEEEVDEDKIYDIFISFSNQDEEFVMQKLLPVLESGARPFKTCVHFRDWEPGELIITHIANSVMNSRRTLVILSNNFLDSVWGIQEFKTAHTQSVKEGRARVVVIKYGELDDNRLDDDIKAYLNTNTYVEWGKPWFWNKLKYALPHSQRTELYMANESINNLTIEDDDEFLLAKLSQKSDESLNFNLVPSSETPLIEQL